MKPAPPVITMRMNEASFEICAWRCVRYKGQGRRQHIEQTDAHVAPARLHRRRLHRRDRPRQHAGAPWHADRPADRRARWRDRGRRRRGRGGGAEVAHHRRRGRGPPVARRARLAARAGASQILFKYCSTFDSTERGNIGPVSEALLEALGADLTIACPALPENGRSIYQGHLFVGDKLLSDTHMRHHPLTPMTDSNLVAGAAAPEPRAGRPSPLRRGRPRARTRSGRISRELRRQGIRQAIADAVSERHLIDLGTACADLALITGGSGIAMGLPANFRRAGQLEESGEADALPRVDGRRGDPRRQLLGGDARPDRAPQAAGRPALALDPLALAEGSDEVGPRARLRRAAVGQHRC